MNTTKSILVTSNPQMGENIWHCWNAEHSFFAFTQRGVLGSSFAQRMLDKEFGHIYMSITYSAPKNRIERYFA